MYARLNLATKPLVSHRTFFAGAALLGVLGGFLFLFLGWRFYALRKVDAELRLKSGKVQEEMSLLKQQRDVLDRYFNQPEATGLQERAKFVQSVIEARSINWTKMFMDLERTLPPGVHVVRIDPRLDKGNVAVHFVVGASSQEAKAKLLIAFENSSSFAHIELLSDKTATQPGGDPLTIEFSAVYLNI
jgi:Tfp pilus assembly protein PilN